MRGKTVGPFFNSPPSKTYRNISTTQAILDAADESLYTDNRITDVGVIGRKWQNLLKKTNFTNFMKKKSDIFTFIISRLFASYLRPIGQWANRVVSRVAWCSELSNATSYTSVLLFYYKWYNFGLTLS